MIGQTNLIPYDVFTAPGDGGDGIIGLQGRHSGQANIAWFDGHSRSMVVVPISQGVFNQETNSSTAFPQPSDLAAVNIGAVFPPGQTWGTAGQNFYYVPQKLALKKKSCAF
ncbi:MAG TPA: H-X9-DG-CTERM domain-containing protein [Fimbriimonadaceae bacterium]